METFDDIFVILLSLTNSTGIYTTMNKKNDETEDGYAIEEEKSQTE